jgi:hypothetical protein
VTDELILIVQYSAAKKGELLKGTIARLLAKLAYGVLKIVDTTPMLCVEGPT